MASESPTGLPRWWPTAVSGIGILLVIFVAVIRIFIPGYDFPSLLYPIIGLMIAGGPAAAVDRRIRSRLSGES